MDAATGERKVLVNAETLETITHPEKTKSTQATGLGRIEPGSYFWSPGGDSLLFAGSSDLVLLDLKTMAPKTLVSGAPDVEDPKFSPDGKWVSFVRNWNLWVVNAASGDNQSAHDRRKRGNSEGQARLGLSRGTRLDDGLLVVAGFLKDRLLQMDERPVTRYPIMDMSSPAGALEYTRFPQAGEAESDRARRSRARCGRRRQSGWTRAPIPTSIWRALIGCATAAASPSSASTGRRIVSICFFAMLRPALRKPF